MYRTDVVLHHCAPFKAHISKTACEKRHAHAVDKAGKARLVNLDYEDGYLIDEKCVACMGVSERGICKTIEAQGPVEAKAVKRSQYAVAPGVFNPITVKRGGRSYAALAN